MGPIWIHIWAQIEAHRGRIRRPHVGPIMGPYRAHLGPYIGPYMGRYWDPELATPKGVQTGIQTRNRHMYIYIYIYIFKYIYIYIYIYIYTYIHPVADVPALSQLGSDGPPRGQTPSRRPVAGPLRGCALHKEGSLDTNGLRPFGGAPLNSPPARARALHLRCEQAHIRPKAVAAVAV
jgi:hypothetical protein